MKNITFSADEQQIERARERAAREGHSLNDEYCRWLADYGRQEDRLRRFDELAARLRGQAQVGRKLSREDMNAR